MTELNDAAASEVEFLQAVREDAYTRGYTMGVYGVLLAIANEGTEAALKSAEEFVFKLVIKDKELADNLGKQLATARARKNDESN